MKRKYLFKVYLLLLTLTIILFSSCYSYKPFPEYIKRGETLTLKIWWIGDLEAPKDYDKDICKKEEYLVDAETTDHIFLRIIVKNKNINLPWSTMNIDKKFRLLFRGFNSIGIPYLELISIEEKS